jgi:hypothetical protein
MNLSKRKENLIEEIYTNLFQTTKHFYIYPEYVFYDDNYFFTEIRSKNKDITFINTFISDENSNYKNITINKSKLFINLSLMDLFYIKTLINNKQYEKKRKSYRRNINFC